MPLPPPPPLPPQTPAGLLTPVVRSADAKGLAQISAEVHTLAEKVHALAFHFFFLSLFLGRV